MCTIRFSSSVWPTDENVYVCVRDYVFLYVYLVYILYFRVQSKF